MSARAQAIKPLAPAIFTGLQPRLLGDPLELYLLTDDIPGHPRRSTVSRETLEKLGYDVPRSQP